MAVTADEAQANVVSYIDTLTGLEAMYATTYNNVVVRNGLPLDTLPGAGHPPSLSAERAEQIRQEIQDAMHKRRH